MSAPPFRLAVVTTPTVFGAGDRSANLAMARSYALRAAEQGADLVCFPETFPGAWRRPVTWTPVDELRDIAATAGVHLVAGFAEPVDGSVDRCWNSLVLIGPDGREIGRYRRTSPAHTPWVYAGGKYWDFDWVTSDDLPVFDTPLGRIGMLVCSEIYVPELARALALKGAEIIVMPAGLTGPGRLFDTWRTRRLLVVVPLLVGITPQSPNHPRYWHSLPRRHGDMVRADGGSAANDIIVTGTHVGTHIDALAHVSQDGRLHGDLDAGQAGVGGRYLELGAHTIAPMVRRGVLLDIPALHGVASCEPGYEITAADLTAAGARQGTPVGPGDVVLIRSGWGQRFTEPDAYQGMATGVPGVSAEGARWLAERQVHAAGADTIAFERLAPGAGHGLLPAHRVLLVEHGIYIIEALALETLAAQAVHEFTFILSPLALVGATGSPARPLAVVGHG